MPSACSGSELAEELEELEELDEEELDELAELEAGELLGWLVEFEGAGAPPPPPPQPVNRMAAARIRLAVVRAAMRRGLDCKHSFFILPKHCRRGLGPVKSIIEY